jgi:hypothetical protein|tara:strand:- start:415 stop:633 length:219 start_codon:yes stop_codon:yes gene_type:complete
MTDRVNITEGMTTVRFHLKGPATGRDKDYAKYIDVRIEEGGQLYVNSSGFSGRLVVWPESSNVVRVSIAPNL